MATRVGCRVSRQVGPFLESCRQVSKDGWPTLAQGSIWGDYKVSVYLYSFYVVPQW